MAGVLKNKYWVLRHGRSIPNEKGLIVSSLEIQREGLPLDKVQIYCSPFSRTRETTKAVVNVLNLSFDNPQVKVMEELRERYFGPPLELQSHDHYREIWDLDERDPFTPPKGGESVANVASRLCTIVPMIESECEGYGILLVGHGDPLQIFQTILHGAVQTHSEKDVLLKGNIDTILTASILSQHRKFALLTGELRRAI